MNFSEAFNALDVLNEDMLTEKQWVAIQPKGSANYYKFLTVDDNNKVAADIVDMLTTRRGTYKQTLDKAVLAELTAELKKTSGSEDSAKYADPSNYTVIKDFSGLNETELKILTLADRSLRQSAHSTFNGILKDNASLEDELKKRLHARKYLIHHTNGNEEETTLDNIILIPYFANDKDDLKVANGIHGALHGASKKSLKTSTVDYTTPLYYFENGQLKEGKCIIAITLKSE